MSIYKEIVGESPDPGAASNSDQVPHPPPAVLPAAVASANAVLDEVSSFKMMKLGPSPKNLMLACGLTRWM